MKKNNRYCFLNWNFKFQIEKFAAEHKVLIAATAYTQEDSNSHGFDIVGKYTKFLKLIAFCQLGSGNLHLFSVKVSRIKKF